MSFRPPYDSGPRLENRLAVACILAGLVLGVVLLVKLLLPWLVGAGLVGAGLWFWHRHQVQRRALHMLFYEQLEARQGRISVLEFAMATQLTGAEARAFLDARAKEFFANFEPTDSGDVLYTFHAPVRRSGPEEQPQPYKESQGARLPGSSTPLAGGDGSLALTPAELARRLGCTEHELAQRQGHPGLYQWSRGKDPDGCGWAYDEKQDRYFPQPSSSRT